MITGGGASMKEPREGALSSPPLAVQLVEALDLQQTFLAGGAVDDDAVHNRRKTSKTSEKGVSYTTEGLRGGRAGKGVVDTRH